MTTLPPQPTGMPDSLWPLAAFFGAVLFLTGAILVLSHLLGERHRDRGTDIPFESGIPPTSSARIHFSIQYYLMAMFFVIFDLEAVFLFVWAVSLKQTGWTGYIEMLFFIAVLLVSLVYLWKVGALSWGSARKLTVRKTGKADRNEIRN